MDLVDPIYLACCSRCSHLCGRLYSQLYTIDVQWFDQRSWREQTVQRTALGREGFVLVGRVGPGILRKELHPLATESSKASRTLHAYLKSLDSGRLRAGKDVATISGRVVRQCPGRRWVIHLSCFVKNTFLFDARRGRPPRKTNNRNFIFRPEG